MILTREIRTLQLHEPLSPGRAAHLSAASGLVWVGDILYVVADDELHLGVFSAVNSLPGHACQLIAGELPEKKKARKAEKPDFETLGFLPPFAGFPDGALVALGSGSKKQRRTGVIIPLNQEGLIESAPQIFKLAKFYNALEKQIPELNIEGAVFYKDDITLLQRGNSSEGKNALIRTNLTQFLQKHDDDKKGRAEKELQFEIQNLDLGNINGVQLCFTDGIALPNGDILFTAAAEDTADTYNDGGCAGSAIGCISASGALLWVNPVDRLCKIEGIAAKVKEGVIQLLMVTDADDANIPASLLAAELPLSMMGP